MFHDPYAILTLIAVFAVVVILLSGIGSFAKGGEFNRRNANKIMRWRLYGQAVAIAVILFATYMRSRG